MHHKQHSIWGASFLSLNVFNVKRQELSTYCASRIYDDVILLGFINVSTNLHGLDAEKTVSHPCMLIKVLMKSKLKFCGF